MRTMTVTHFKAHALEAIAEVAKTRESLTLTKRGKPIAKLLPYSDDTLEMVPGKLSHLLDFEEDIVTPLGEDLWSAAK